MGNNICANNVDRKNGCQLDPKPTPMDTRKKHLYEFWHTMHHEGLEMMQETSNRCSVIDGVTPRTMREFVCKNARLNFPAQKRENVEDDTLVNDSTDETANERSLCEVGSHQSEHYYTSNSPSTEDFSENKKSGSNEYASKCKTEKNTLCDLVLEGNPLRSVKETNVSFQKSGGNELFSNECALKARTEKDTASNLDQEGRHLRVTKEPNVCFRFEVEAHGGESQPEVILSAGIEESPQQSKSLAPNEITVTKDPRVIGFASSENKVTPLPFKNNTKTFLEESQRIESTNPKNTSVLSSTHQDNRTIRESVFDEISHNPSILKKLENGYQQDNGLFQVPIVPGAKPDGILCRSELKSNDMTPPAPTGPMIGYLEVVPASSYLVPAPVLSEPAFESETFAFLKCLVTDIDRLSDKRKRLFKEEMLFRLNDYLDDNEIDAENEVQRVRKPRLSGMRSPSSSSLEQSSFSSPDDCPPRSTKLQPAHLFPYPFTESLETDKSNEFL